MANSLYARLMNVSDEPIEYPNIPKVQFFAALREWVRGEKTQGAVATAFVVSGSDTEATALMNYINGGSTLADKLDRIAQVEDVFCIHEKGPKNDVTDMNPRSLYPDKTSIKDRFSL